MKKGRKYGYIIAFSIFCIVISVQIVSIVNATKGTTISSLLENINTNVEIGTQDAIPIYVDDIVNGLGISKNYAVFANTFSQETHMEGNIAVKDAYINQIFNFTKAVVQINKSNSYSITVNNKINDNPADGTFKFALFTKEIDSQTGEEHFRKTDHDIITVTTKNGEGTATFENLDSDTKYYIFELDENNNPIMNNTTTSDGTIVTYGEDQESSDESDLVHPNTSYIQNINTWSNHAADANDGENPKLIIPMKEYLSLIVDQNGNLAHNNSGIVLSSDSKDFELIVIAEDGENYKVVRNDDNGAYELQRRDDEYKIINFEEEFKKLNNFSSVLYNVATSSSEVNVINLDADGKIYENNQVNGLNNGKAESETLDVSKYLENNKYLVINVDMSGLSEINLSNTINWGDLGGTYSWNTVSTRILWNFYNKESNTPYTGNINIYKNNIIGTILAPSANVVVGSTINASIISDKASNPGGEIHKSQFNSAKRMIRTSCLNVKNVIAKEDGEFSIKINKIDSDNAIPLSNATFKITLKQDDRIILEGTDTTNDSGEISISGIKILEEGKKYNISIEEVSAPEGYSTNKNVEFEVVTTINNNKYVLQPVETFEKDGAKITIKNELINVTIPNSKVRNSFNINLIKRNIDNNNLINGIVFDITVFDENNNPVKFIDNVTDKEINLEGLVTGEISNDGAIKLENIRIDGLKKYTITITERKNDFYKMIEPIIIDMETILDNGEYKLGKVSLDNEARDDVIVDKQNNTILLDVKNEKELTGTYNIILQKINSITKEGLNGVKFNISIYDDENNIIMNENMATENIEGKEGYINIDNIVINKPGIYMCVIKELESLDGYKKFDQIIVAELEFAINESRDAYEIKSFKNLGEYSENLKMQIEDNNNLAIVLANDPSDEIQKEIDVEGTTDEKVENSKFLPQTGDNILGFVVISIETILLLIACFIYRKNNK